MASSLFNDDEKASIQDCIANVHETFKQEVYVFIEEAQEVELDTSYNPLYERTKNQSKGVSDKKLQKYTIQARVNYFKKGEEDVLDDTGLPSSENVIRLKVDNDANEKLKNAAFVEVDGNKCSVISDPEGVGPFSPQYYKVYLRIDA